MLLMIDNYDSFTYNLVQFIGEFYGDIKVFRNDAITVEGIASLKPAAIVVSPGPCTPKEAGVSVETIKQLGPAIPILGVCLGHQSIGYAFGGNVVRAPYLMHGKVSPIEHDGKTIFTNQKNPFTATRYHSLIIDRESCPACLTVTAWTSDNIIMGVRHKQYPIEGVQFHPESILTEGGKNILKNFITTYVSH
jgi:anthranilate synthase/aminodeoxychorismate synthase-like glutamine amidotransferase